MFKCVPIHDVDSLMKLFTDVSDLSYPQLVYELINSAAPSNIFLVSAVEAGTHPVIFAEKLPVYENIQYMFVTLLTSHPLMSWLNAVA